MAYHVLNISKRPRLSHGSVLTDKNILEDSY